jgi:hypothetical protein
MLLTLVLVAILLVAVAGGGAGIARRPYLRTVTHGRSISGREGIARMTSRGTH